MKAINIGIIICGVVILTIIILMIVAATRPYDPIKSGQMSLSRFNSILSFQDLSNKISSDAGFTDPTFLAEISKFKELIKSGITNPIAIPLDQCPNNVRSENSDVCKAYYNNHTAIIDTTNVRIIPQISGNRIGGDGWEGLADFRAERRDGLLIVQFSWGIRVVDVYIIIVNPSTESVRYLVIRAEGTPENTQAWIDGYLGNGSRFRTDEGILTYEIPLSTDENIAPILTVSALPVTSYITDIMLLHSCKDGKCYGASYTVDVGKPK